MVYMSLPKGPVLERVAPSRPDVAYMPSIEEGLVPLDQDQYDRLTEQVG